MRYELFFEKGEFVIEILSGLVYLASPYSHSDPAVVQSRVDAACKVTGELMLLGHNIYSPIAHSHHVCQHMDGANVQFDHDFWLSRDLGVLDRCDAMIVLLLPGWEDSRGVRAERKYCEAPLHRIPTIELCLDHPPGMRAVHDWLKERNL